MGEIARRAERTKIEAVKELRSLGLCEEEIINQLVHELALSEEAACYLFEKAAQELEKYTGRTKFEHLQDSVQFWQQIVQNKDGIYTASQQADARKQLDKVLGLIDTSKGTGGVVPLINIQRATFERLDGEEADQVQKILDGKVK